MKTFKIHTLGCKVNAYESSAICQDLKAHGYVEASENEQADVYIIHTCAVTNTAAAKSRQKITQAKKLNPNTVIVAIGCYVQSASSTLKKNNQIDILIGNEGKNRIPALLDEYFETHEQKVQISDLSKEHVFEDFEASVFEHQCRAYLKIQDGCNQFCSYCIIPYTRGRECSLPLNRVIQYANNLVKQGHHEIVLTGIHTGRYGNGQNTNLNECLKELCKIDGLERIRLSSIEVIEITDELIETMKNNPKIARHLHIPLQAGDNHTLKEMHRPYTVEDYKNVIDKVRKEIGDVSISSDIITGFPSETQEHFNNCESFIKECGLSFLHVFPFSVREGTAAAKMKSVCTSKEKKDRAKQLSELSTELKHQYYSRFVGKTIDVMVESYKDGAYYGYSSEYIWTRIEATNMEIGKIVPIVVKEVRDEECVGVIANEIVE